MKITHFCNSFIAVKEGKTILACDPWVGTANYGGWLSYPISSGGEELLQRLNPTHLYISHFHSDHLDERLLKTMDANIPVFIKNFENKRLLRRLASLGLKNIVELPPWESCKISEEMEIAIVPCDASNADDLEDAIDFDIDTSILIRSLADDTVFFNKVDSPMTLNQHRKVREFVRQTGNGKIDVACLAVGASSEYPQCFLGIDRPSEKKRVVDASLKRFAEEIGELGNEAYFPAGGTYVIPGKFSMLNRYIAQPSGDQLCEVVSSSKDCKLFFDIEGGGSIEKIGDQWVQTEGRLTRFFTREEAIRAYEGFVYEYADQPILDDAAIDDLFSLARRKYFERLEASSVIPSWKVVFHLYDDLQLDAGGSLQKGMTPLKTLVLSKNDAAVPYELICHLDRRLFTGLLKKNCIWNISLSGSIVIFERTPNVFIPAIPFSLNYLTI
jgi:L-ascorbate metabolism protein UlaG (beta-lactamase superfamily)